MEPIKKSSPAGEGREMEIKPEEERPDLVEAMLGLEEFRRMQMDFDRQNRHERIDAILFRLCDGLFRILEIWIALSLFNLFARS